MAERINPKCRGNDHFNFNSVLELNNNNLKLRTTFSESSPRPFHYN